MKKQTLRETLPTIRVDSSVLAEVSIAGDEYGTEIIVPIAMLWRKEDLLDRIVIWKRTYKDEFRRDRVIFLLGKERRRKES